MNSLFLVERTDHVGSGNTRPYNDQYASMVVCAPDEDTARQTHPEDSSPWLVWTSAENVRITLLGTAVPEIQPGVVHTHYVYS